MWLHILYTFCFLSPLFDHIYKSHDVSEEAQAAITLLPFAQENEQKSKTSHKRKECISCPT
jgi:hypothetical protein